MELNLKRALKLRRALEAHVKGLTIPTTVSIAVLSSTADQPMKVVAEAQEKMVAELGIALLLTDILSKLRTDILKANVSYGIEDLLAQSASLDRQIAVHNTIQGTSTFTPDEGMIAKEIQIARKAIENPDSGRDLYGRPKSTDRTVSVALISEEVAGQSRKIVAALRRKREDVDDQRIAANAKARIEIAEDSAEILREIGLI